MKEWELRSSFRHFGISLTLDVNFLTFELYQLRALPESDIIDRMAKYNQKIVTLGGGTGQFHLLTGLRDLNNPENITAIAGNWDSGGSSGRLRSELGVLPPGDIRRCLLALMEDEAQRQVAQRLFDDRLEDLDGVLKGHSIGNLITARLDLIFRGQDRGTDAARELFRIQAKVLPISLDNLQLVAQTKKGNVIEGETNLDNRKENPDFDSTDPVVRIYFNTRAAANPEALAAIKNADKIVLAPGDLYTSILPHLLVDGVKEAILESKAKLIFVLNLMTKPGETDFYQAADFLNNLISYLGDGSRIDYIIANDNHIDPAILEIYKGQGQEPIAIDEAKLKKLAPKAELIKTSLANYMQKEHLLRHDSTKLALSILDLK